MKLPFLILVFFTANISLFAQDTLKQLDHSDFLIWKTIQDQQLSSDGTLATYRTVTGEGDPQLAIYFHQDSLTHNISRVSRSTIDYNGKFIYGLISPHRDSLRKLERKKIEKKDWPSDTLFIYDVASRQTIYVPYATNYKSPEKAGDWLAYTVKKDAFPIDTIKKEKKSKKEIVHLIVRQLSTGQQDTLKFVKEFTWAEKAPALLATVDSPDSTLATGV